MNYKLQYISDSLIIEKLAIDVSVGSGKIALADASGIMSSVIGSVKSYVMSIYDKDHPVASIVSFLGPGLLFKLGFPWLSLIYSVADALGFNWTGFWSTIGNYIGKMVQSIISSGKTMSDEDASSKIEGAVASGFQDNFSGQVNKDKLLDLAQKSKQSVPDLVKQVSSSDLQVCLEIKKFAHLMNKDQIIKQAGIKDKMIRFFAKIIGWLIKTALISLGFVGAEGVLSALVGGAKKMISSEQPTEDTTIGFSGSNPVSGLKVSPSAPQDLFNVHSNDMSSVWMEHGDISNISDIVLGWVLGAFPQLKNHSSDIQSSATFEKIINMFQDRNKMGSGFGVISVPRPYQRKIDIVSPIVNSFLQDHPDAKSSNQTNTNSPYTDINKIEYK